MKNSYNQSRDSYFLYCNFDEKIYFLWSLHMSEASEKSHNSTFRVKISVYNVIFSNYRWKSYQDITPTYFSLEFGKK